MVKQHSVSYEDVSVYGFDTPPLNKYCVAYWKRAASHKGGQGSSTLLYATEHALIV